jgi:hypothetical protein
MIAEPTAWDFVEQEGGDTQLAVLNPTFILGPTLTTQARPAETTIVETAESLRDLGLLDRR